MKVLCIGGEFDGLMVDSTGLEVRLVNPDNPISVYSLPASEFVEVDDFNPTYFLKTVGFNNDSKKQFYVFNGDQNLLDEYLKNHNIWS
ncbi:hypothetical protein LVY74_02100 [Acinetobacter sp. ME22]|uniref:hypothetical protein n=1 Tax=Acinetobacter sp. ME22 TaxID=2904802 RepID=UPI001EDB17BA|nr:hypothetical protein [Acinetobacter sp. ME22]MCG2572349.1 hypothetical protein [Acinetobacter sp. ME22]